jgi:hypothetical protein
MPARPARQPVDPFPTAAMGYTHDVSPVADARLRFE